jgi:hypothetical protein
VVAVLSAVLAGAFGVLRYDRKDERYLRYWAPKRWTSLRRWVIATHLLVGGIGALAAAGLRWFPTTESWWWIANAVAYATASVALFRADVSGWGLGNATTGHSLFRLVLTRQQDVADEGSKAQVGTILSKAPDDRLIELAHEVTLDVYKKDGSVQVGFRELTEDISKLDKLLHGDITILGPKATALDLKAEQTSARAWLRDFTKHSIHSNRLAFDHHVDGAALMDMFMAEGGPSS